MKRIDERRFDFIPQKMWKSLSKTDRDNLRNYRGTFRWYNDNDEKIKSLEKELKERKEKKKGYVNKLTKLNYNLDHLRNDYRISFTLYKLKHRPNYYNCCITRKGHVKNGTFGSEKVIVPHLEKFYKRNKSKLDELKRLGWNRFVLNQINDRDGKIYFRILSELMKDSKGNSFTLNREFLFPLKK